MVQYLYETRSLVVRDFNRISSSVLEWPYMLSSHVCEDMVHEIIDRTRRGTGDHWFCRCRSPGTWIILVHGCVGDACGCACRDGLREYLLHREKSCFSFLLRMFVKQVLQL